MTGPSAGRPASYVEQVAQRIFAERHPGETVPASLRDLYLGYAVLALVAGDSVTTEDVHNAWSAWATVHCPSHPSLRPFSELSRAEQDRDEPFCRAIRRVARSLAR